MTEPGRTPESADRPDGMDREQIKVETFTPDCRRVLERGEHALIGVSTGNSYFTQRTLAALLKWAVDLFDHVDVIYTDLHLADMYAADGYTPEHAASRAKKTARDAHRRIRRAVEQLPPTKAVQVRALSECATLPGYQAVHTRLESARSHDQDLARICDDHVVQWLADCDHTTPANADGDDPRHRAALAYLMAELPILTATPEALDLPSSVCCYHTFMPILHGLRRLDGYWHPAQAHAAVHVAPPPEAPAERSRA